MEAWFAFPIYALKYAESGGPFTVTGPNDELAITLFETAEDAAGYEPQQRGMSIARFTSAAALTEWLDDARAASGVTHVVSPQMVEGEKVMTPVSQVFSLAQELLRERAEVEAKADQN